MELGEELSKVGELNLGKIKQKNVSVSSLDHALVYEALVAKSACKEILSHFLYMTFTSMSDTAAAVSFCPVAQSSKRSAIVLLSLALLAF
jgi:hypothetical protein